MKRYISDFMKQKTESRTIFGLIVKDWYRRIEESLSELTEEIEVQIPEHTEETSITQISKEY